MTVFLAFQAVNTVIIQSANQQAAAFGSTGVSEIFPLAIDLPLVPLALGAILSMFITETVMILGVRMFARDTTTPVSTALFRGGLVFATLNGVIGSVITLTAGVLFAVLPLIVGVGIGMGPAAVILTIPGLFVLISLFFVRQEIAVKNKNFIDALTGSWALTRGARVSISVLVLLTFVVNLFTRNSARVFSSFDPTTVIVLITVVGPILTVFLIAVTTRAYMQLNGDSTFPADSTGATESSKYVNTPGSQ